MPLELGEQVPEVTLTNQLGEPVPLARYWQHEPAVLFFVRHLG